MDQELAQQVAVWQAGMHATLSKAKIPYQIKTGVRAPQLFTFRAQLGDPADWRKVQGMDEQLAMAMHVESVILSRSRGYVDLQISLPHSLHRMLTIGSIKQKGGTMIGLGQTPTGAPVYVDVAGDGACHAMISGATGCGKTGAMRAMACILARQVKPDQVRLILIDAKGSVLWKGWDNEAHLAHPIILDAGEAVQALAWCLAELDRRRISGQRLPRIIVMIDEIALLLRTAEEFVSTAVQRLTAIGRELGMHVVMATQYPTGAAVGGVLTKANLVMRLTGACASASEAAISTGLPKTYAERLRGHGDMILSGRHEPIRLQVAWTTARHIETLPRTASPDRLDLQAVEPDACESATDWIEPADLAEAMIADRGVQFLKGQLRCGQTKAQRIRHYQEALRDALRQRGYEIVRVGSAALSRSALAHA